MHGSGFRQVSDTVQVYLDCNATVATEETQGFRCRSRRPCGDRRHDGEARLNSVLAKPIPSTSRAMWANLLVRPATVVRWRESQRRTTCRACPGRSCTAQVMPRTRPSAAGTAAGPYRKATSPPELGCRAALRSRSFLASWTITSNVLSVPQAIDAIAGMHHHEALGSQAPGQICGETAFVSGQCGAD